MAVEAFITSTSARSSSLLSLPPQFLFRFDLFELVPILGHFFERGFGFLLSHLSESKFTRPLIFLIILIL